MRVKFRRPSASMVVALLALFLALGGVSYAKFAIPAGSVGTAQLRTRAVTNHKLANGSVGNAKLAVKSVGTKKIIPGAVGSAQIHPGAVGSAQISPGAVGSAQIHSGAIGSAQISPGAVGAAQINSAQVQARVTGACSGSLGAIGSIGSDGKAQCTPTLPQEYFGALTPTTVVPGGQPVTLGRTLPPGPYLLLVNPYVKVSDGTVGSTVEVDCTMGLGGIGGGGPPPITNSLVVTLGAGTGQNPSIQAAGTISLAGPIDNPEYIGGYTMPTTVSCSASATAGSPTVQLSGTINAIQTQTNTS